MSHPRFKAALVLLGLLLLAPPESARSAGGPTFGELVISDTDAAAWMTINNTFMREEGKPWDPVTQQWDGVLIQLGQYDDVGEIIKRIAFEWQRRSVEERDWGTFKWINIVAEDPLPNRKPPMDPAFRDKLLPSSVHTACSDVDDSVDKNRLCLKQTCSAGDLLSLPRPCLRLRSLHGYFTPKAIITYWQGINGFDLSVGPLRPDEHVGHTFTFRDEVKIYIDGQELKKKIDTIRVVTEIGSHTGVPHGGYHSPPWSE